MPLVKVKSGLSHGYFDTATRSHAYHQAGDEFDASPAEMVAFGDKFILVIEVEPPVGKIVGEPKSEPMPGPEMSFHYSATRGAVALATEHGISLPLSGITGTGRGGKIVKADVQAVLNGDAE